MARTCDNSGFVFLILLQKEDLQMAGCERGEPEGAGAGGYRRSVWVIGVRTFLRGRARPSTSRGELFAQRPPLGPRTFLKLFIALSRA